MAKVAISLWAFLLLSVQIKAQIGGPLYPVLVNGSWGYINDSADIVVQPQYEHATFFLSEKYAIVKKNSKYGVLSTAGSESKKCLYDSIIPANDSLILVQAKDRWTVEYSSGELLIKDEFDSIHVHPTHLKLYHQGKCGLYDLRSLVLAPIQYDNIKFYNTKYLLATKENRMGVIDKNGGVIIPFKYSNIIQINDSITRVESDEKWGLISTDGRCNIAPKWSRFDFFGKGYIKGLIGDYLELCEYPSGKVIANQYHDYYECSDEYIAVRKGLLVGVINTDGEELVPPLYDEVTHLVRDYFSVKSSNGYGIINSRGDTIIPLEYTEVALKINSVKPFFSFFKNNKMGLVNSQGEVLVPPKFTDINLRDGGGFRVVSGRLVGFYGANGREIFPAKYHVVGRYKGNTIQARYHNCYALANQDTLISEAINDKIVVANNIAKLYRDSILEVVELDNSGKEIDRYEYYGMDSYTIAETEELALPPYEPSIVYPAGAKNIWRFSQKLNKWGLVNSKTGKQVIKPTYDRIHRTTYLSTYLTEVFVEPTSYSIGGAAFKTISLYGAVSVGEGAEMLKPEYVYIQLPMESSHLGHTTSIDWGIHISGKWDFVSGPDDEEINFIGNRLNNTKRVHRHGYTSFGAYDSQISTYPMEELVDMLTERGTSWIEDSATTSKYMDEKHYLNCYQGDWRYIKFNPSVDNRMAGTTSRIDYHWNAPLDTARMVVASNTHQFGVVTSGLDAVIPLNNYSVDQYSGAEELLYVVGRIEPKYGFIDTNGDLRVEAIYDQLNEIEEGLAPFHLNGRWGYLNMEEEGIIPPTYQRAEPFNHAMAIVKKGRFFGAIDRKGEEVIPFEYRRMGEFVNNRAIVKTEDGLGLINERGEFIMKPKYSGILSSPDAQFYIVKNKKSFGLIDRDGREILSPKFKKVGQPGEAGAFFVKKGKMYALYNTSGKRIIKFHYRSLKEEKEGAIAFKKDRHYGYMDAEGNTIIPEQYSNAYDFRNGLAKVKIKKTYGYINKKGEFVIEPIWKSITDFTDGYAVAEDDSGTYVIRNDGQVLGTLDTLDLITNFIADVALARGNSGKIFFVNPSCNKTINRGFEDALPFTDGLAPVKSEGQWGVINGEGREIVAPQYHGISGFKNGFAKIEVSPFYSLTDRGGKVLLESNFEKMIPLRRNLLYVEKNKKVGYVKADGSFVWELRK